MVLLGAGTRGRARTIYGWRDAWATRTDRVRSRRARHGGTVHTCRTSGRRVPAGPALGSRRPGGRRARGTRIRPARGGKRAGAEGARAHCPRAAQVCAANPARTSSGPVGRARRAAPTRAPHRLPPAVSGGPGTRRRPVPGGRSASAYLRGAAGPLVFHPRDRQSAAPQCTHA